MVVCSVVGGVVVRLGSGQMVGGSSAFEDPSPKNPLFGFLGFFRPLLRLPVVVEATPDGAPVSSVSRSTLSGSALGFGGRTTAW